MLHATIFSQVRFVLMMRHVFSFCLKGLLHPKQPTNQPTVKFICSKFFNIVQLILLVSKASSKLGFGINTVLEQSSR